MNCNSQNISSLKGIEYFPQLTTLDCYSNRLTSLDVTQNMSLNTLYCYFNRLTSLDASRMASPNGYRLYFGNQTDADGNTITLQLTLREQQRSKWDESLKSNANNGSIEGPTYGSNP